jgi:riboflavin synthase
VFTGIINHIGTIEDIVKNPSCDLVLVIKLPNKNINRNLDIGCSIACSGICLTLLKKQENEDFFYLEFGVSDETVSKTNISSWRIGDKINIEFALRMGDELGGHMVSGHIDSVALIKSIKKISDSYEIIFEFPSHLKKFIASKGSIVLNGVSLTINEVDKNSFSINLIEHSFLNTNFNNARVGNRVNLEIDMIARYLNQLISQ